ncbi:EAL domain-containing protein [Thioalkalicoccus limnaeus]|uniref:EAL domain-containing protein n=1 Tax=Thioalkalicoccus limnaeus TaxID=120681 RepID=A0ABV4BF04_9GAMM
MTSAAHLPSAYRPFGDDLRLRALLEALPDLVFEVDRDGRIHAYHAPTEDALAVRPPDLLGRPLGEILPEKVAGVCLAALEEAAGTGASRGSQYRLDTPAGRRWFELSIVELGRSDHADRRFLALARDITDRRRFETALDLLTTRLAGLSGEAFHEAICRHLAEELEVDRVFIGHLDPAGTGRRLVAGWVNGQPTRRYDDPVAERGGSDEIVGDPTPVGLVGVAESDEGSKPTQDIAARYELPLFDEHRVPLGIILLENRRPFADLGAVRMLVDIFDRPVAAELEHARLDAALRHSEGRFRQLLERLPRISVQGYDANRRVIFWNEASEEIYGYTADEAMGQRLEDLIIPETMRATVIQGISDWIERGIPIPAAELELLRKDRTRVPVFSSHVMQRRATGEPEMYCIDIDLTDQRHAQHQVKLAASVFTHAREGILITDPSGVIVEANEAFCRSLGYDYGELVGQTPRIFRSARHPTEFYARMWQRLRERGYWTGEIWNRTKDGQIRPAILTISAVRDEMGQTRQYVGLYADISAQKAHEAELEFLAHYDPLTRLPNRNLLRDRLEQAQAQSIRRRRLVAVAYIDLDGFKTINDRHGHEFGDRVLMVLADRMRASLRKGETLARIGGDEFAAVLVDLSDQREVTPFVDRLLGVIAEPIPLDDEELTISASIGISIYPQMEPLDAEQLLRQADLAMYEAKRSGKNRFNLFDADLDRRVRIHHAQLARMRRAIHQKEIELFYEPKVDMRTGTVIGCEALLRWRHPEQGLLSPASFLPELDQGTMGIELGEWVLDQALRQRQSWQTRGLDLSLSVNIAAYHLQRPDFVQWLRRMLTVHPGAAGGLELEVLETSALTNLAAVGRVIEACQDLGVKVALDDFGTGYSSLTYLRHLPAGLIKIDRSFVAGMREHQDDLTIVEGVLGLARAFRRQILAEGVETVEHGRWLLRLGCRFGQGYGIARAMPADELPEWLAGWQPDPTWSGIRELDTTDKLLLHAMVEVRTWSRAIQVPGRTDGPCQPRIGHDGSALARWLASAGRTGADPHLVTVLRERLAHARGLSCGGQHHGITEAPPDHDPVADCRDALLEVLERLAAR